MSFAWEEIVTRALSEWSTPFYLSAWNPVLDALDELRILEDVLPVRHWLSFKTHPVRPLIRQWRAVGNGIEIVSEYEFLAALSEGFPPESILINGVAKDTWLRNYKQKHLKVHFDSIHEVEELATQAKELGWHTGIRVHVSEEYDPDEPHFSGQFGLLEHEAKAAVTKLRKEGVLVESVHFHLRSNVSSAVSYRLAIADISRICQDAEFHPTYLDCGGGLPAPGLPIIEYGKKWQDFDLSELREVFFNIPAQVPSVREIWLENGRFLTARSAVLVVRILDVKERSDSCYLICDGGRTNHALVSDWETHDIFTIPIRNGMRRLTTVCGPTCMAFDRLLRVELPENIEVGDYIVWVNAGAYHIPWETRFSHGLANVLWCDENGVVSLARGKETFSEWWGKWR